MRQFGAEVPGPAGRPPPGEVPAGLDPGLVAVEPFGPCAPVGPVAMLAPREVGPMSNGVSGPEAPKMRPPQEGRRPRSPVFYVVIAGVVVVALAAVVFVAQAIRDYGKTAEFPSLAAQPDPSLKGTVAYLDWNYPGCVHVIAAAGTPAKTFGCDGGSSLTWLADGRLQILGAGGENPAPAWGKIVDVRTGAAEQIPASELPAKMPQAPDPTLGPNGERLLVTNDGGVVELRLEDGSGSRVLMTAEGGSQYTSAYRGGRPTGGGCCCRTARPGCCWSPWGSHRRRGCSPRSSRVRRSSRAG